MSLNEIESFFWEWYPHEISWLELKEINPDLYCKLINYGNALVLSGRLKSSYLPK